MVKNDPRVHKASEVHKRRAPKKLRAQASEEVKAAEEVKPAAVAEHVKLAEVAQRAKPAAVAEVAKSTEVAKPAGAVRSAEVLRPAKDASSRVTRSELPNAPLHVISSEVPEGRAAEKSPTLQKDYPSKKEHSTEVPKSVPSTEAPKSKAKSESSAESTPEPSAAPPEPPKLKPKPKRWGLRIAITFVSLIIASALIAAGFYAGSRWLRYNDEHSIEGTWYVAGTDVPLEFRDGKIAFNASTSYDYEINATDKTISYSLGGLEGQGRYWFSPDRSTLIITDGADYSMWSTLFDDLRYDISCIFGNKELPARDDSIVLTHAITLSKPQTDKDQNTEGENTEDPSAENQSSENSDERHSRENFSDLSISDVLMSET